MSAKLPAVRPREVVRVLRLAGFIERRQKGSHLIMFRELDKRRVVVPMHQGHDVPPGTLRGILRDADISVDQFVTLLNE